MAKNRPFILLLAAFGIFQAYFTFLFLRLPQDKQMNFFPDDAFYYLNPAVNIAKGLGPTNDGLTITSGYHPLWMGIMSATAKLIPGQDKNTLFNSAVIIGGAMHALAAALIFLLAAPLIKKIPALIWSSVYFFCESAVYGAMQGLESSVLVLLLVILLLAELRLDEGVKAGMIKGFILGLIFLARTDAGLFIAAWFAVLSAKRIFVDRAAPAALVKELALAGAAMFIAILPWLLYSHYWYGTFLQNSLIIKKLWRARLDFGLPLQDRAVFALKLMYEWTTTSFSVYPLTLVIFSLLGGAVALNIPKGFVPGKSCGVTKEACAFTSFILILAGYIFASGAYYSLNFILIRLWYYAGAKLLFPLAGIWLFMLMDRFIQPERSKLLKNLALTVLVLINLKMFFKINYVFIYDLPRISRLGQFVKMTEWMNENLPKGSLIGSYDAGTFSYYSKNTVINLDGLANTSIIQVSKDNNMEDYIDKTGIKYIVDYESIFKPMKAYGLTADIGVDYPKRRLVELHRIHTEAPGGDVIVCRVIPKKKK